MLFDVFLIFGFRVPGSIAFLFSGAGLAISDSFSASQFTELPGLLLHEVEISCTLLLSIPPAHAAI